MTEVMPRARARVVKPGVVSLSDAPRRRSGVASPAAPAEPQRRGGVVAQPAEPQRRSGERERRSGVRVERERPVISGANALDVAYAQPEALPVSQPVSQPEPKRRPGAGRLLVAPPLPVSVPKAPFLVLLLVIVVAGVIGVLVINTKINENAFRLDDLHNQQSSLDQQEQQLTEDLADRETPGNLSAAAQRLGLVPAGTPAFIVLPNGQPIGVPQPATGTPSVTSGR